MADFRAVAIGDFSTLGNWEYSTDSGATWAAAIALPTTGDDVYANGYNITFDQDAECSLFSNASFTGVAAGGQFQFGAAASIIGDFINGSGTTCVVNNTGVGKTITGDINGSAGYGITGNALVTIIGNVTAGTSRDAAAVYGLPNVIVTGTARASSDNTGGDLTRWSNGIGLCTLATVGTAIGHPNGARGVFCDSGDSANVDTISRANSLTDGTEAVYGDIIVINIINSVDAVSLLGAGSRLSSGSITVELTVDREGGDATVSFLASDANYPTESNVKDGVVFGNSDQFTGTLEQVDAAQLASDLLDEMQTSNHVIAQRLRASATDDSVGEIVSSTLRSS
jgi:hypothetical protein